MRRIAAAAAGICAAVLVAAPAFAHVTVNPDEATQGRYAKLAFRVPNERDSAQTVGLEVRLPADAPIANVSVKPLPGWKAVVTKGKIAKPIKVHGQDVNEAVTSIVWTLTSPDAAIAAGQFQEFEVSAGPLPEADKIVFKALQTYSTNEIVRWIDDPVPAGQEEPEHPAPVLKLAKAATGDTHGAAATTSPGATVTENVAHEEEAQPRDALSLSLAIAGLVIAVLALSVAILGRRRPTP